MNSYTIMENKLHSALPRVITFLLMHNSCNCFPNFCVIIYTNCTITYLVIALVIAQLPTSSGARSTHQNVL